MLNKNYCICNYVLLPPIRPINKDIIANTSKIWIKPVTL